MDTCHPRLKAAFVIEQGLVDSLRLELEYKKNSLGEFDEISRRWLRLKGGGDAPADFLDINMLDLVDP